MTSQPSAPCAAARVALSAQLDHEDPGTPAAWLAGHLDTCAECRRWLARAERVTRAVQPTRTAPDLTAPILAAVTADAAAREARSGERLARWRRALQLATVAAAAAQLVLAMPGLLGAAGFGPTQHSGHERASLDAALAVGFLLAGLRPALARAFTPVAMVLALCLTLTSGLDVLFQRVTLGHEATHLVVLAQAALVWALSYAAPAGAGPAGATGGIVVTPAPPAAP
jgi:predicted anti-sigma-YlaC factor YlaD